MAVVGVSYVVVFAALIGLFGLQPAQASVSVAVLTVDGRGWGHGVGLSQHGAKWMGEDGASAAQILQHFYPGTSMGTASGAVQVAVHSVPAATVLAFPNGGEVRGTGEGFPVGVQPGGQVRVAFESGAYRVDRIVTAQSSHERAAWAQVPTIPTVPTTSTTRPGSTTTTRPLLPPVSSSTTTSTRAPSSTATSGATTSTSAPGAGPPPTAIAPGDGVRSSTPVLAVPPMDGVVSVPERGRQYRGVIRAEAAAGPLRLINEVGVEQYLRGMGEMPASWPQAAQQAQAVAARTYALRAMAAGGEICDYDRCQVYLGQQVEQPGRDQAVAATRGQVIGYGGRLAAAVYASNHGGFSATTLEGFGTPDGTYPYLKAVRYTTRDPFPWKVDVALTDLARRLGYGGTISAVTITERGPSGRALTVTLAGDAGEMGVTGLQLTRALRLRSTLWEVRLGETDVAPPPPPEPEAAEDGVIQALPDDERALSAASLKTADSIELEGRERRRDRARQAGPAAAETGSSSSGRVLPGVVAGTVLLGAALMVGTQVRHRAGRSGRDVAALGHRIRQRTRRHRRDGG